MIVAFFLVTPNSKSILPIESNLSTELLFQNFSLVEMDEEGVKNQLNSSLAIKDKAYFKLNDINITYQKEHHLLAKNALYREDFVYLKDEVSLERTDGLRFTAHDLTYSIKEGSLHAKRGFTMDINKSHLVGENLHYNLKLKSFSADKIRAKIILE